jgi:hypothetical protein
MKRVVILFSSKKNKILPYNVMMKWKIFSEEILKNIQMKKQRRTLGKKHLHITINHLFIKIKKHIRSILIMQLLKKIYIHKVV